MTAREGEPAPGYTTIHSTGVRIIGSVGIGEVQITTFFYRTKSYKNLTNLTKIFLVDGDLTEDNKKCLGPPLS